MNHTILTTAPHRLSLYHFIVLRGNAALRDAYNRRWNVALF